MVHIQCQCGAKFRLPGEQVGRPATCTRCRSVLRAVSGGGTIRGFDARLVIEAGPARVGEQFLLGGQGVIKIGKLEDRPIRLEGMQVSRNHCRLARSHSGSWMIEDAKSTNGVFVNGRKTRSARLHHGDRLRIGEYTLVFASRPTAKRACKPGRRPLELDDLYALAEMEAATAPAARAATIDPGATATAEPLDPVSVTLAVAEARRGPRCPNCHFVWPSGTRICAQCGVHIRTGRAAVPWYAWRGFRWHRRSSSSAGSIEAGPSPA